MAVLEAVVEDKIAGREIPGQGIELADDAGQFVGIENADALQPLGVGDAGLDVEQEEFAIEDDVVAGAELLDACVDADAGLLPEERSEEHTSELQSLMRISSAVFCLKKKTI